VYKTNHVIGLPVIALEAGQELGVVRDVLFDEDWRFQGLLVEVKAFFRRGRYIPSDSIHAIGEDCVTIVDEEDMLPAQGLDHLNGFNSGPVKVKGKPVITSNGEHLGQLEDVYFDFQTLRTIVGYEISDGLLADLVDGRRVLRNPEKVTIGEDALVIPVSEEIQWQVCNNLRQIEGEE
jgi:uncharacterized protein YrrD